MAKQIADGEVTLNIVQYLFNILNGLSTDLLDGPTITFCS